jgi:DNA repair protein RecN (Recombination protein N)
MHLTRLRIENIALVDSLDVELPAGLIAVTGETGAGKSMILGSLHLLLGQRADSSLVREEGSKGRVEGLFEFGSARDAVVERVHASLQSQGLECEDDEPLILRRELSGTGRSTAALAGCLVSARQLADVAEHMVDIHSQHDQQSLVQRRWQRDALDAFAQAEEDAAAVRSAYAEWQAARQEYEHWLTQERELRQREDLLRYQLKEIDDAALAADEEAQLLERETLLANAEEIGAAVAELLDVCEDETHGVVTQLQHVQRLLSRLHELGVAGEELEHSLRDATLQVEELARHLNSRRDEIEADPEELGRVQDRLHVLSQLKKKYGATVAEVIAFGERVRGELEGLGNYEERVEQLEQEVTRARAQLVQKATQLTKKRGAGGPKLARAVEKELAQLGMGEARFEVGLEELPEPSAFGLEEVEFRIAANPGEQPQGLSKVASGGELSRIMLALKCVATSRGDVPILVFDEIDAGISGKVAHAVATRLEQLAQRHQVFVITHMPQIACRAATQYTVEKHVEGKRTSVSMRRLSAEEREAELARMLGGESAVARAHAKELLGGGGKQ